jgi:protein-tyrosine phosphatase
MEAYRRLPLGRLFNARDLGGYPVPGGATQYGRFIRCEAPTNLPQSDLAFLREYGVTTSIDFRGDSEVFRVKSSFEDAPGFRYIRSPTFNAQVAFGAKAGDKSPPVTPTVRWGDKYIEMADTCADWVRATLTLMAEANGAVIYNCTTGKDRTGIISALLLSLAGVCDADIIADYCVSQVYLMETYEALIHEYNKKFRPEQAAKLSDPFFLTSPENMEQLLWHLGGEYGGVPDYLRFCGLDGDTLDTLRRKLVQR